MTREDPTIKIYDCLIKRRYLNGKNVYEYKRRYVPIPSSLHNKVESFLNQRLKINITKQKGDLVIILHPVKTFLHTKTPPDKTTPKQGSEPQF